MADKKKEAKKEESDRIFEERIEDLENQLKRSVADYRNLEKRCEEEKRESIRYANKELLLQLLPAFETLIIAEKYVKDEGLRLTIKHVLDVLNAAGVERVVTEGKKFDAMTMECIEIVEGDENMVIEEVKPGFMLSGKLLIPARVKVGGKEGN